MALSWTVYKYCNKASKLTVLKIKSAPQTCNIIWNHCRCPRGNYKTEAQPLFEGWSRSWSGMLSLSGVKGQWDIRGQRFRLWDWQFTLLRIYNLPQNSAVVSWRTRRHLESRVAPGSSFRNLMWPAPVSSVTHQSMGAQYILSFDYTPWAIKTCYSIFIHNFDKMLIDFYRASAYWRAILI